MAWVRDNDGLRLVGEPHYSVPQIRQLIEQLRQARNQPHGVCALLEVLLSTGRSSRKLIWRLSKWCDWDDSSQDVARAIADQLFHGIICRRLLDQRNRPWRDPVTAEADYQLWLDRVSASEEGLPQGLSFPDDVDESETYVEGAVQRVLVNAYERNPVARRRCIEHYGPRCFICCFDFEKAYAGIGQPYIHVHHLRKRSEAGGEHQVNPIDDLRPVCPNCHAVIHMNREPRGIDELKAMVASARKRNPAGPFA